MSKVGWTNAIIKLYKQHAILYDEAVAQIQQIQAHILSECFFFGFCSWLVPSLFWICLVILWCVHVVGVRASHNELLELVWNMLWTKCVFAVFLGWCDDTGCCNKISSYLCVRWRNIYWKCNRIWANRTAVDIMSIAATAMSRYTGLIDK